MGRQQAVQAGAQELAVRADQEGKAGAWSAHNAFSNKVVGRVLPPVKIPAVNCSVVVVEWGPARAQRAEPQGTLAAV